MAVPDGPETAAVEQAFTMVSSIEMESNLTLLEKPEPEDTLWRYMDMRKFLWMMETESLYARNMSRLEDEFEGTFPQSEFRRIVDIVKLQLPLELVLDNPYIDGAIALRSRDLRGIAFVNCWHKSEDESFLMWREYSDISRGIAVKTNFGTLKNSLPRDQEVILGNIKYMGYDEVSYENVNRYNQLFLKQTMYSWEQEVRLMGFGNFYYYFKQNISHLMDVPESLFFEVDLANLIHNIVVAPYATNEFIEIIESVASRHGMADRVTKSSLKEI